MKKHRGKIVYTACIVIGAGLVFYKPSEAGERHVFILAAGFIMLMFGLYKVATQWVKDTSTPLQKDETDFFEDDEVKER